MNSLPVTMITAKSLEAFKTRLGKFGYTHNIVCDLRILNNRTGTHINTL